MDKKSQKMAKVHSLVATERRKEREGEEEEGKSYMNRLVQQNKDKHPLFYPKSAKIFR